MVVTVWVAAWQLQCCGDPFTLGQTVEWTLETVLDFDWLDSALGREVARTVQFAEEHHGGLPDDAAVTRGTVRSIRSAYCQYEPAGRNLRYPSAGSAVLHDVTEADGWEVDVADLTFNGYVVELDLPHLAE